jgi:hypothetical protein
MEDAARSIVRGAALGEHGSDVAASADESLVASGLEAGEGSVEQMGEIDEWEPPTQEEAIEEQHPEVVVPDPEAIRIRAAEKPDFEVDSEEDASPEPQVEADNSYEDGIYYEGDEDNELEQTGAEQGGNHRDTPVSAAEEVSRNDSEEETVRTSTERDWLSEVSDGDSGETLEWPAPVARRSPEQDEWRRDAEGEEPLEEPRVRHLFPVPDDADWEVGELDYDRDRTRVS